MNIERLSELEAHLNILREQQVALEREVLLTTGLAKVQAEQRLRLEIKPKIEDYDKEYWQIVVSQANCLNIEEEEAKIAVIEIVEQIEQIEKIQPPPYSTKILDTLNNIHQKLNQPKLLSATKIKAVIPLIPSLITISYETEIDTQKFFNTHFPTFTHLLRKILKKK